MISAVLVCASLLSVAPLQDDSEVPSYSPGSVQIVVGQEAGPLLELAASELRRYGWLRTGRLPRIASEPEDDVPALILRAGASDRLPQDGLDPRQNHAIWIESRSPLRLMIEGASERSALWAAWSLIESWGFGFYLGGDTAPPKDPGYQAQAFEQAYRPTFAVRGSLPWLNFLNSPTTWNLQDYKTFFEYLARQKANLIAFRVYDHEPFAAYGITRQGAQMGRPLMTTTSPHRWWSPPAMPTSDFLFGSDLFFDRGEWGCEVGIESAWSYAPGLAVRAQQQMMAEALRFAREVGLQTCLGFEVSGDPDDPEVQRAFRRRLAHVLETYPLDYFAIWQSEGLGAGGPGSWGERHITSLDPKITEAFGYLGEDHDLTEAARITKFVLLAHEMLEELAPEVRLVVSGWGGDAWFHFTSLYPGLDRLVPGDVIFSALDNIDPRLEPNISQAYGRVGPERQCWPVPWFESDGGHTRQDQTGPQTNVTAFEPLLRDMHRKEVRGVLGIHWRTRNVEDVAGYALRFAWDPELTAERYLRGYAADHYGPEHAERMRDVYLRLEELGPQYVGAVGCTECSTGFDWFVDPGSQLGRHDENLAGHLPDPERVPELEALSQEMLDVSEREDARGQRTAAVAFHDLGRTIQWLLARSRTGMAIGRPGGDLEVRLRAAERTAAAGDQAESRRQAQDIVEDLEALRFQQGLEAIASTCRTRGELGMLATANARYGRFYAGFVGRLERLLGRRRPDLSGRGVWQGDPLVTLFRVPGQMRAGESIAFDAIAIGADRPSVRLERLDRPGASAVVLEPVRLGGRYHRALFEPKEPGLWSWTLVGPKDVASRALPSGAIRVLAAIPPAPRVGARHGHQQPVFTVSFQQPLEEIGQVQGKLSLEPAPCGGLALGTRRGGFLEIRSCEEVRFDGPFSLAFSVRPEPWPSSKMPVILSKGSWDGGGLFVQLFHRKLRIGLGGRRALDVDAPEPGRWTHLVVTFDGATLRLYRDGQHEAKLELWDGPGESSEPLRIGAHRGRGDSESFPFAGCIGPVRFFDRALEPGEVEALK